MPRINQQVRGIYNKNIKTSYMAIVNNEQRELQTWVPNANLSRVDEFQADAVLSFLSDSKANFLLEKI